MSFNLRSYILTLRNSIQSWMVALITPLFVGRQAEVESLLDGFAQALHGRGSMVALSGEAGIGKARAAIDTLAPLPGMFKLTSFHISQDAQADPRDRKTIRGPVRSKSS